MVEIKSFVRPLTVRLVDFETSQSDWLIGFKTYFELCGIQVFCRYGYRCFPTVICYTLYNPFIFLLHLTGPGEQGAAVILSADEEKKKDSLYKVNGFNAYASDKISLDRALKDIRHPE